MRITLLLAVLLAASLAGCTQEAAPPGDDGMDDGDGGDTTASSSPSASPAPEPTTHDVDIADFAFEPSSLAIRLGDTVRWTNMDGATHTATADDGTFDSGHLATGESFEFTFDEAGTYDYICTLHPSMTGTITVEAQPKSVMVS